MIYEAGLETSHHIALLTIRVVAGILFFAQGYDKLFVLGINRVKEPFTIAFQKAHIPDGLLRGAITVSTLIEFICGLLLIAGLFRDYSVYLLLLNLVGVAAGFCLVQPVWDLQHYFPRLVLLILILLLPPEWDAWRLETILFR